MLAIALIVEPVATAYTLIWPFGGCLDRLYAERIRVLLRGCIDAERGGWYNNRG